MIRTLTLHCCLCFMITAHKNMSWKFGVHRSRTPVASLYALQGLNRRACQCVLARRLWLPASSVCWEPEERNASRTVSTPTSILKSFSCITQVPCSLVFVPAGSDTPDTQTFHPQTPERPTCCGRALLRDRCMLVLSDSSV